MNPGQHSRYIALLRGINVSGQKLIKMTDLQQYIIDIGGQNVVTYIQSGNVIFDFDNGNTGKLAQAISDKIFEKCHFTVPVMVLTVSELTSIFTNNPFLQDPKTDISHLYVTLLTGIPVEGSFDKLRALCNQTETIEISGSVVYLKISSGYGRAVLNNNTIEKVLKVSATTRNWKTIEKLITLSAV